MVSALFMDFTGTEYDFFNLLRWIGKEVNLIRPLEAEVRTLLVKASFLQVFRSCSANWEIKDGKLEVLLVRIREVFRNADQDLRRLWADVTKFSSENYSCMPINLDDLLLSLLKELELLNPDIQEVYTILSRSSRTMTDGNVDSAKEKLNSLIENIEDLLRCNGELVDSVKKELEAVQRGLGFMINFLDFTAKRCCKIGKLRDFLIHAEFMTDNISCLLYLCCVDQKMTDQMAKEMKMQLSFEIQRFNPAQPDVKDIYIKALTAASAQETSILVGEIELGLLGYLCNFLLLPDTELISLLPIKAKFLSVFEDFLFFIKYFTMGSPLKEHNETDWMFKNHFEHINAFINAIEQAISLLHDSHENEEITQELKQKTSDFLSVITIGEEIVRKLYYLNVAQSLGCNFAGTSDGQSFIGSLIAEIMDVFKSGDFSTAAKQPSQFFEYLYAQILDSAHQIEYVIDSMIAIRTDSILVARYDPQYCYRLAIFNALQEIKKVQKELTAMKNRMTDDTLVQKPCCFPSQVSQEANSEENDRLCSEETLTEEKSMTKMVIFGQEAKEIRERLTNGTQKLNFLSIVGMPGIGKTTLADSLFQDSSVTRHFHVQARCVVSQVHDRTRLLREILQEITGERNKNDDDALDQKVYQSLKCRRYLIFMDDIWDIQPWEDIKVSFPDDKNGSRIMFTSRSNNIASQFGSESINYYLSPISEEKSWEMLQFKLFGKESCPQELVMVGCEIAASCKGLPLTIDLVTALLLATEREKWTEVAESIMKRLLGDPQGQCSKVLEFSYNNLPDELKPCFLYFAAFPEDADVPTRKLILLWIAEGFVQLNNFRSLEDAAEDILNDLIARSLVIVSKRRPLGGIKAIRVHDLLHEFASAKAQEESFILKVHGKANISTLSCDGHQSQKQIRLSMDQNLFLQFHGSKPSCPHATTLICSATRERYVPFALNFSGFKLLWVLDIPTIHCYDSSTVFELVDLRFLSISLRASKILSEIHRLPNLETLIMNEDFDDAHLSLEKISTMKRLSHIYSRKEYISFKYCREKVLEVSFLFKNLRTLKGLKASYAEDIGMILKLIPNLVKLEVLFYNPDEGCYPFPKLDFLEELESLEVTHLGSLIDFKLVNFPYKLKRLILSNFRQPWTEISHIGNLEFLEILKLRNGAFKGPKWDMIDVQFPELKYLSFSHLDIEEWNATEDHLSCFQQLHVDNCMKLKELPSCLAETMTLQEIKLRYCSSSAENSAKKIKEEQEEKGNEQLVVDTYVPPEDNFDYIFNV